MLLIPPVDAEGTAPATPIAPIETAQRLSAATRSPEEFARVFAAEFSALFRRTERGAPSTNLQ